MERPPEEPPPPDPIMINAQEPTTIEDLQGDTKKMTGEGFRYNSGGSLSKPKNENLRKFVSLKIK